LFKKRNTRYFLNNDDDEWSFSFLYRQQGCGFPYGMFAVAPWEAGSEAVPDAVVYYSFILRCKISINFLTLINERKQKNEPYKIKKE